MLSGNIKVRNVDPYEIVCFSDGFMEIMGEKVGFDGASYEELSSDLYQFLLARSVRFYLAAYSKDLGTLNKISENDLLSEMDSALSGEVKKEYKLGGNNVINLNNMSRYKKPMSIKVPQKINDAEYIVDLKYDDNKYIHVTLNVSGEDIKVKSFLQ